MTQFVATGPAIALHRPRPRSEAQEIPAARSAAASLRDERPLPHLTDDQLRRAGFKLVQGQGTGRDDILGRWYIEHTDGRPVKGSYATRRRALARIMEILYDE